MVVRWLPGYKYRKKLTATASGTTATDYQVMWRVYYVAGTDATNQVFIPKCKTDLSDIRFTLDDGYSTLPFWIEHPAITGSGYNVWVKIPSVLTTGTAVYLYYGRDSVASGSDGVKTFDFFDDFEGSALSATKWLVNAGTLTVANSELTATRGTTNIDAWNLSYFGQYYATRARLKTAHSGQNVSVECFYPSTDSNTMQINADISENNSGLPKYAFYDGSWHSASMTGWSAATYHILEFKRLAQFNWTVDGANLVQMSYAPTALGNVHYWIRDDAAASIVTDWVMVRKCVATEPTCTVTGIEERNTLQPILQKGWRL